MMMDVCTERTRHMRAMSFDEISVSATEVLEIVYPSTDLTLPDIWRNWAVYVWGLRSKSITFSGKGIFKALSKK